MSKVKSIEAFETSDGSKFFEKIPAERQQTRVDFLERKKSIQNYLFDLMGIEDCEKGEDGPDRTEEFYNIVESEGLGLEFCLEKMGIVELITDLVTFRDGALLKTAEYAKELLEKS